MVVSERTLEMLKKDYSVFEKKYNLPSFKDLNQDFEIEELAETETDFLLRVIRRSVVEKVLFFSKFVEAIINPCEGSSLFLFSMIKSLNQEDRKTLSKMYEDTSKLKLQSLRMDLSYSEKEEADFIRKVYSFWEDTKEKLSKILESMESNWDNETKKSEKSYFR